MSFDVRVPVVGESVQEGGIYKWHKKSGDFVNRDDVLLELETDKATVEIVAEASGVLETLVKEGDTVKVGDVIARIEGNGKAAPPAPAKKEDTAPAAKAAPAKEVAAPPKGGAQPLSPAVERMVKEQNLDTNLITGTGKGGRITKEDVVNFVESREAKEPSRPVSMPPPPTTTPVSTPTIAPSAGRGERREKMSRLRQRIAERLVEAQHNAAMLTTFNEIDMSAVMDVRKRYKDAFKEHHQVNLGFMSFFVKAAVNALKEFQGINAYIDGTDIIYHDYYDVGIAVSTDKGLIVPVVRNADALTFAEIEKTIGEYAAKGREGKIALDDLSGGTFTITNGGVFGSLLSTPILNPPQSAILGMHKIQQRPMVIDNEIVIRPMMYVALSYDHRIVDGKEAVGFLVKIKENIEDPARLLLGV